MEETASSRIESSRASLTIKEMESAFNPKLSIMVFFLFNTKVKETEAEEAAAKRGQRTLAANTESKYSTKSSPRNCSVVLFRSNSHRSPTSPLLPTLTYNK